MPRLDERLKSVARQICSRVHADIGSDHAHLLVALLKAGRIEHGIAIENKRSPLANSAAALRGLSAEVRLADGLSGLQEGEADSLSVCGMGGRTIASILAAFPNRVPPVLIAQPNRNPERVRQWAYHNDFHVADEQITNGNRSFTVLRFHRSDASVDPAYDDLKMDDAFLFGPLILKTRQPNFIQRLSEERDYLLKLDRLGDEAKQRLAAIERTL